MLVFFTTDAPVSVAAARELARISLKPAFEQLTIDGCTSTNDTVLLFANGAAGGDPVERGSAEWDGLALALREMGDSLAYQLAADAEGGTKVLLIDVEGAQTDDDAERIAKAIANSVLVKTAAFGGDPNPGRFVQALGSSGAGFDAAKARIMLGDVLVADAGRVLPEYDEGGAAHQVMKEDEIRIAIRLGDGTAKARAIGCDLSYEYVKINAEYTT
jgi:glutamate N-acetyltransferase/amino-acid N-acetyltransferase